MRKCQYSISNMSLFNFKSHHLVINPDPGPALKCAPGHDSIKDSSMIKSYWLKVGLVLFQNRHTWFLYFRRSTSASMTAENKRISWEFVCGIQLKSNSAGVQGRIYSWNWVLHVSWKRIPWEFVSGVQGCWHGPPETNSQEIRFRPSQKKV